MVKQQQKTVSPKKGREGKTPQPQPQPAAATGTKPASGATPDTQFAQLVKASAQQIWSAGLAAFAKAQDQGRNVFDNLAAEGAKLQDKARDAEVKIDVAAHRMSDMAGEVGGRAGQHWDKLESIFEDRVARALARLGMPTAKDVAQLTARIDALTATVAALQAAAGTAPAGSVKPAARTASAKATKPEKAPKATKASPITPATKTTKADKAKQAVKTAPVAAPVTAAKSKGSAPAQAQKAARAPAAKPVGKPTRAAQAVKAGKASRHTKA